MTTENKTSILLKMAQSRGIPVTDIRVTSTLEDMQGLPMTKLVEEVPVPALVRVTMSYDGDGFWKFEYPNNPQRRSYLNESELNAREKAAAAALRTLANKDGAMEGCSITFMDAI